MAISSVDQNHRKMELATGGPRNIVYIGLSGYEQAKFRHLQQLKATNPSEGKNISWHTPDTIPADSKFCNLSTAFWTVSARHVQHDILVSCNYIVILE